MILVNPEIQGLQRKEYLIKYEKNTKKKKRKKKKEKESGVE
jgi:hypothetical protein